MAKNNTFNTSPLALGKKQKNSAAKKKADQERSASSNGQSNNGGSRTQSTAPIAHRSEQATQRAGNNARRVKTALSPTKNSGNAQAQKTYAGSQLESSQERKAKWQENREKSKSFQDEAAKTGLVSAYNKSEKSNLDKLTTGGVQKSIGSHLTTAGDFLKGGDGEKSQIEKNWNVELKRNEKLGELGEKIKSKGDKMQGKANKTIEDAESEMGKGEKFLADTYLSGVGMATDTATGSALALPLMASRVYGGALNDMETGELKDATTAKEKRNYATGQAVVEVLSEMLGGGAGLAKTYSKSAGALLDGFDKTLVKAYDKVAANINNKTLRNFVYTTLKNAGGMAEEAGEELVAAIADPFVANKTYANNVDARSAKEYKGIMQGYSGDINSEVDSVAAQYGIDRSVVASAYAEGIQSDDFFNSMVQDNLKSGMSEREAQEFARGTQAYLAASLTGNKKDMSKALNELMNTYTSTTSIKQKFSVSDAAEAMASAGLLTGVTGGAVSIANNFDGAMIRKAFEKQENVNNAASAISFASLGLDDKDMVSRAQAMYENAQQGKDLADLQYAELGEALYKQAVSNERKTDMTYRVGMSAVVKNRYMATGTVEGRDENGHAIYGGEVTSQRATTIRNSLMQSAAQIQEAYGEMDAKEVDEAIESTTAVILGLINDNTVDALTMNHPMSRALYESATGVTLPVGNEATRDYLFKEAAKNMVETARLETVNTVDVKKGELDTLYANKFGGEGQAVVDRISSRFGVDDAAGYVGKMSAMSQVYSAGLEGLDYEAAEEIAKQNGITAEEAKDLYDAGVADKENNGGFSVTYDVRDNSKGKIRNSDRQFFLELAKIFGVNIVISDNLQTQDERQANGSYEEKTNTLYLNLNDAITKNIGYTITHELTHRIKLYNRDAYEVFAKSFKERAIEKNGQEWFDEAIKERIERYTGADELDEDGALEEIIADQMGEILHDREFIENFVSENTEEAQTILSAIRDIIRKITQLFAVHGGFRSDYNEALLSELGLLREAEMFFANSIQEARSQQTQEMLEKEKYLQMIEGVDFANLNLSPDGWLSDEDAATKLLAGIKYNKAEFDKGSYVLGTIPEIYTELFNVGALDIAIRPEHTYENLNTKEQAIEDGRYKKGEGQHFHNVPLEEYIEDLKSIADPAEIYDGWNVGGKKGKPRINLKLKSGRLATIEFYSGQSIIGSDNRKNHAVITLFKKNDPDEHFERNKDKLMYKKSSDISEATRDQFPSSVKVSELEDRLSQFNEKLNTYKKNRGINYSIDASTMPLDSEGRELTQQQEEFFRGSKVRDENGQLLVVYHGTSAEFDVFKNTGSGHYFTANPKYAERYGSNVRAFYLNIVKPFDVTQDSVRDDFVQFVRDGYSNSLHPTTSIADIYKAIENGIDWTEADNLIEWIEENELDYDGLIIDEGGDLDENGEVFDRGKSYVSFNSNQAKLTSNENPTENESVKLSMDAPYEETRDLVAVHNVKESDIAGLLKLNGIPMPSIAVIKAAQGHDMYGEYSFIFGKDTIDPAKNKANKVYGGDAWTPVFPTVEYEVKDDKAFDAFRKKIADLTSGARQEVRDTLYGLDYTDMFNDRLRSNNGLEKFKEALLDDTRMMQVFLDTKGQYVDTIVKKEEDTMSPAEVEKHKFIIDKLGEDVVRASVPDKSSGVKIGDYRREYLEKNGEAIKEAYKAYGMEIIGLPEDVVDQTIEGMNRFELFKIPRTALQYLDEGPTKVKETPDYRGTEDAIREKTDEAEYKKWLDDLFGGLTIQEGLYNGKDYYTPSGDRRSFKDTHMDATLNNIVKAMKLHENGETMLGHSFKAVAQKKYDSIADIKADSKRLEKMSEEEYSEKNKEFADRESKIIDRFFDDVKMGAYDNPFIIRDTINTILVDSIRNAKSSADVLSELKEYPYTKNATKADADAIWQLVEDVANMPTGYFEAKPERAVTFDEVQAVIAPDNAPSEIIDGLKEQNVDVVTYEAGNEEDRKDKLNSLDNVKFSISMTTDGRKVVVVNDEIVSNELSEAENKSNVRTALGRFPTITVYSQKISFVRKGKKEFTNSADSRKLRRMSEKVYIDKLNVAGHPYDILYASTNYVNEGLNHERNDNIVGFARGSVLLQVHGRKYEAEVIIAITDDYTSEFYDVINLKPTNFEIKKEIPRAIQHNVSPDRHGQSLDAGILSSRDIGVNSKSNAETEDSGLVRDGGIQLTWDMFMDSEDAEQNFAIAQAAISDLQEFERKNNGNSLIRTVGKAISTELVREGFVNFMGRKVSDARDVAEMCQVLRDPRFETSRIIMVKGDEVVSVTSVTSKLPGTSAIFKQGMGFHDGIADVADRMRRCGADGYYMVHNHPSGNVKASTADISSTAGFIEYLPGFKGHIILDHNKFGLIEYSPYSNKRTKASEVKMTGQQTIDFLHTPELDHELLGTEIRSATDVGELAKAVQMTDEVSVVVYTNTYLEVVGVQEIDNKAFNNKQMVGYFKNRLVDFGAYKLFVFTKNGDVYETARDLARYAICQDAIYQDENGFCKYGMLDGFKAKRNFESGVNTKDIRSYFREDTPSQDEIVKYSISKKADDFTSFAEDCLEGDTSDEAQARRQKARDEVEAALANIVRKETQLTYGKTLNRKSVKKPIKDLVLGLMESSENTHRDKMDMVDFVMDSADAVWNKFYSKAADLSDLLLVVSREVIENIKFVDDEMYQAYQDMRSYLRNNRISVPDFVKDDISWADYRKKNFGRMKLTSESGFELDKKWDEIAPLLMPFVDATEYTPDGSDNLMNVEDMSSMFLAISDALDNTKAYRDAYADAFAQDIELQFAKDLAAITIKQGEAWESFADKKKEYYETRTKEMQARHKVAMRELREQRDKKLAEAEQKRKDDLAKQKQKYEERDEKRKIAEAEKKEKQKAKKQDHKARMKAFGHIEHNYNWLTKRLLNPKKEDDQHIPEGFISSLARVLAEFDMQSQRSLDRERLMDMYYHDGKNHPSKPTEALRKMREELQELSKEDESGIFVYNGALFSTMDKLIKSLDGHPLRDINTEDLEYIDDMLASIKHMIQHENKLFADSKKQAASSAGEAVIQEMSDKITRYKRRFDRVGPIGRLDHLLNESMMTPMNFFKSLGGEMHQLYKNLRYGQDDYIRKIDELRGFFDDMFKPYRKKGKLGHARTGSSIYDWSTDKSLQTFKLASGEEIQLTVAQMMSLYCHSKREQSMKHILGSGVVISDIKMTKLMDKLSGKVDVSASGYRMTYDDVISIIDALTDEQKEIAQKMQELLNGKLQEWGNETSMQLYGIRLFREENYFPIAVNNEDVPSQIGRASGVTGTKISNFGFTKDTDPKAGNRLIIGDIFDIVADHANKMALYSAYAAPLTDFNRVLNYKQKIQQVDEDGKPIDSFVDGYSVKGRLKDAYGSNAIEFINNFLNDVNGQAEVRIDGVKNLVEKALANTKKASIGANLRVLVQQPTAIVRAAYYINPIYFANPSEFNLKKNVQEMHEHCPIAAWKAWGNYQNDFTRGLQDIITNNGSRRTASIMWENLTMGVYGFADDMTWGMIWGAVKNEVKAKHPNVEYGSEEFWVLCNERASLVFDETQVVDSVFHRSDVMRNKDALVKTFSSFMAEPTRTYNMMRSSLVLSYRYAKDGNHKAAAKEMSKSLAVFVANAAAVSAAAALVDALRGKGGDDDDEYWELWYTNFLNNFADNVELWNNIVYAKDITGMLEAGFKKMFGDDDAYVYQPTNMVLNGWYKLATGLTETQDLLSGDMSISEFLAGDFVAGLGYITGVPAKTMGTWIGKQMDKWGVFATDELEVLDDVDTSESRDTIFTKLGIGSAKDNYQKHIDKLAKKYDGKSDDSMVEMATDGYRKLVDAGDFSELSARREAIRKAGGDVDAFDEKIHSYVNTTFKKTIGSSTSQSEFENQQAMKDWMLSNGWTEQQISDVAYRSDTAREFKAACRMLDHDAAVKALTPLLEAGLTEQDIYKLWNNRNRGNYDTSSTGTYVWGTEGTITSGFGNRGYVTAGASSYHQGIDIGAEMGTNVVAADGGVVTFAGNDGSGYGNYIIVTHDNGSQTYYGHLSGIGVRKGQRVSQSQPIGNVGSTGVSTGPHLHFALKINGTFVDPSKYIKQ